ncbi:MAG: J domain-containing protein [Treponema sp.]|nr:J domain-containing protein [Treponema sp.]
MHNHYSLLGVGRNATAAEIKKAFREKAKRLHPDIAGNSAEGEMRKLLTAYETLSSTERRSEYDRVYSRFTESIGFDYRAWLREQADDPASQAKLILYELLHLENDEAIALWRKNGGINFPIDRYMIRDDWMDCYFILAEELDRRQHCFEAFRLLALVIREERRLPYFRRFTPEIEKFIREIVRRRLRPQVDDETWIECMEILLGLGFPERDNAVWLCALAKQLHALGDHTGAQQVVRKMKKRGAVSCND